MSPLMRWVPVAALGLVLACDSDEAGVPDDEANAEGDHGDGADDDGHDGDDDGDDDDGDADDGDHGDAGDGDDDDSGDGDGDGGDDGPAEPLTCEDKSCGSDFATGEFCGGPCPIGEGCSEAGQCGAWPPHIDQIYDGAGGFQLPPCDHGDDPGADLEMANHYPWIKTMRPVKTDCPSVVQQLHPLAMVGAEIPEDQGVYVFGSCVEYSDGQWGTAYDGTIVWGQTWPGSYGDFSFLISWRAIIDHKLDPPAGIGIAHIHSATGLDLDCEIEMEVTYEMCPIHRDDCGNYPIPY